MSSLYWASIDVLQEFKDDLSQFGWSWETTEKGLLDCSSVE
jgi:hypothetical protein